MLSKTSISLLAHWILLIITASVFKCIREIKWKITDYVALDCVIICLVSRKACLRQTEMCCVSLH